MSSQRGPRCGVAETQKPRATVQAGSQDRVCAPLERRKRLHNVRSALGRGVIAHHHHLFGASLVGSVHGSDDSLGERPLSLRCEVYNPPWTALSEALGDLFLRTLGSIEGKLEANVLGESAALVQKRAQKAFVELERQRS